ncbi:iron-siderophore ABC transporter substrate-binding protein [Homoserinibacter sp. YIM 151385]|uniref:iron-siderophore ABC transporter substrate-binding protein n=1 Tax=Homoserinibacter sp. YIM 151385 TaxID=2985506 RepID=UPI0022F12F2C|nr:iron-siderophore ABC transporter substrate-binding protein [Homoserinibacter sp. YIM 151385]WBU38034.1 iron-siderophore ABC transporter substrate-binding protein [Homoserinibacter sp. YIM 151385]
MRITRTLAVLAAATLATGLAACSSGPAETGAGDGGDDAAFPVTIEHVYGETTIEAKPERVATVAWANHEVPLALGVVPVGMEKATWGDDDGNGILPWVEDALAELGGEEPVLFDGGDGIDFEAIADTQPDVILASYSGLTEEEYDTLSKIAPTVAYPEIAWGTTVDQMIELNSKALGLEAEGQALIEDLEAQTTEALEANPGLEDTKALFAFMDPSDFSQIGYYTLADTRPGFLAAAGLPQPSLIADDADTTEFYLSISSEEAEKFEDVDVFVTYGDPEGDLVEQMQADPLLSKIPAIAEGRIAILPDATPLAASANPGPLSIPWGLTDYFKILADAANAG